MFIVEVIIRHLLIAENIQCIVPKGAQPIFRK